MKNIDMGMLNSLLGELGSERIVTATITPSSMPDESGRSMEDLIYYNIKFKHNWIEYEYNIYVYGEVYDINYFLEKWLRTTSEISEISFCFWLTEKEKRSAFPVNYTSCNSNIIINKYIFNEGDFGEQKDFSVDVDKEVDENDPVCRHVINGRVKYMINSYNEGGGNYTTVCGECIIEAIEKIKKSRVSKKREFVNGKLGEWISFAKELPPNGFFNVKKGDRHITMKCYEGLCENGLGFGDSLEEVPLTIDDTCYWFKSEI